MTQQTAEIVKKAYLVKDLEPLVDDFLSEEGISKPDMLVKIGKLVGRDPSSTEVDILSLNFVGSLRSVGYIVSGGRYKKLGEKYRILGFEAPKIKPTVDQWDDTSRLLLEKIHSLLPPDSPGIDDQIRRLLWSRTSLPLHEMSQLYYLTYELGGKSRGFFWSEGGVEALIFQRDVSRPSFRLAPLGNPRPEALWDLCRQLGMISVSSVKVINALDEEVQAFKSEYPSLYWERGRQAVYCCQELLDLPSRFLNERARTNLRKNLRSMEFRVFFGDTYEPTTQTDCFTIIDLWRQKNEPKQRQLAITRDYLAVTTPSASKITILGYREGLPSCLHILDRLTNRPEYVAQIVEKSLNYSDIPGGGSGTADANLFKTAEILSSNHIRFINAGMYNGGTEGLAKHKLRFRFSEETDQSSLSITTPFRRKE